MNHNNDDINEACSSLLESPPYRNKEPLPVYRQYGQTSNSQQQQQQQQNKQAPTLPVMCTLISPPTPDKPAAFACSPASTLKHANTTAAAAATTTYYTEPQKTKSVSFAPTATVQPINIPKASEMTTQEKQLIWYLGYDYNQFKNNAASDGGVKLVRSMKDSCHFFCIGSFDGSCDEDTSSSSNSGSNHSSDAATAGSSRTSPSGKFYKHEYNDYMKEDGQEVCKRGLGYHFSRIRKRNRVMTRSAVVAWQKCMQKPSNKQRIEKVVQRKMHATPNLSSSRKNRPQLQQTQSVVLGSVSTKCSRVSREEALWRGNIDFRVAYPERCRFGIVDSIQRKRSSGSAADDVAYHAGKRRRSNECAYSREADGNNSMKVSAARYAQV